jgi:alpha-amylase
MFSPCLPLYSVDGVRIDTVKHVRKDFWPAFANAAGVFTLGEVLEGTTSYVAEYQQVLDSVLNYPAFYQNVYVSALSLASVPF